MRWLRLLLARARAPKPVVLPTDDDIVFVARHERLRHVAFDGGSFLLILLASETGDHVCLSGEMSRVWTGAAQVLRHGAVDALALGIRATVMGSKASA